MAFSTSSMIGVDLQSASSTALFTLNQICYGSDDTEWIYVKATGAITTGYFVMVNSEGTAYVAQTAILQSPTVEGYQLACVQCSMADQYYAWAAVRGHNIIVACSGTVPPTVQVGMGMTSGVLCTAGDTTCTMRGIYVTTSASTAGISRMARAILTYPRVAATTALPLG